MTRYEQDWSRLESPTGAYPDRGDTEHDPGAANENPPDPDLDACDTLEEVLGWLLNNAPADERIEVNEVVEAALRRIEQIMLVVS